MPRKAALAVAHNNSVAVRARMDIDSPITDDTMEVVFRIFFAAILVPRVVKLLAPDSDAVLNSTTNRHMKSKDSQRQENTCSQELTAMKCWTYFASQ